MRNLSRLLPFFVLSLAPAICLLPGCQRSGSDVKVQTVRGQDSNGGRDQATIEPQAGQGNGSSHDDGAPGSDSDPDHGPPKKHKHTANRLAEETSPYLLMHAHNPVQWYPWGEEAFAKAQREKKLIFLSVGYSSCYWCHVMERESFMDEEIAKYLNDHFVCIKVDREERPDVDDIYMLAVQLITRRGGWPLSAFLTPSAKPFYGGTYFPPRAGARGARVGFLEILRHVQGLWEKDPQKVRKGADQLASAIKEMLREQRPEQDVVLNNELPSIVLKSLQEEFDPQYGGFGYVATNPDVPKFPTPPNLMLLIERLRRQHNPDAEKMLLLTLEKMAQGGIWDHWGGGFHRYSTDRYWRIPHFEKMLYDNGQLATVYAEAYGLTEREDFRWVVVELLDFVQREMTSPDGGFYSAIDAETDAVEGKFYRWSREELKSIVTADQWPLMARMYHLDGAANFEHTFYVPYRSKSFGELAGEFDLTTQELRQRVILLQQKLLEARNRRKRPLTDTKILTAWNALMVRGYADAGRILEEPKYIDTAARGADFVLAKLRTKDGRLLRTYGQGTAKLNAYLDDYAFLVDGLIALHRATDDGRWLDAAAALTDKQIELFWDDDEGGFFFTSDDHEALIARAKKPTDSVLPSGNAVAAQNLIYLAEALSRDEYRQRAKKTIEAFAHRLTSVDRARSMPAMAVAVANWLDAEQ